MCNIHYLGTNGKQLSEDDTINFFNLLYNGSLTNPDAYGFYSTATGVVKDGKAFHTIEQKEYQPYIDSISKSSNFAIGHNRIYTSGKPDNNANNHPFESDNFVVVHNGILRNDDSIKKKFDFDYKEEVDSAVISHLLEMYFKRSGNEELAIKNTAETLRGSFSVLVVFKPKNTTYYFKEYMTKFYWFLVDDRVLVGSTSETNFFSTFYDIHNTVFMRKQYNELLKAEASKERIYKLVGKNIRFVCTFEENKQAPDSYNYSSYSKDKSKDDAADDWEAADMKGYNKSFGTAKDDEKEEEEDERFMQKESIKLFLNTINDNCSLKLSPNDRNIRITPKHLKLERLSMEDSEKIIELLRDSIQKTKQKKGGRDLWFLIEDLDVIMDEMYDIDSTAKEIQNELDTDAELEAAEKTFGQMEDGLTEMESGGSVTYPRISDEEAIELDVKIAKAAGTLPMQCRLLFNNPCAQHKNCTFKLEEEALHSQIKSQQQGVNSYFG